MNLSNLIYKATKKYKIPARIYTAILMQESRYKVDAVYRACGIRKPASYNEVCVWQDFGIAQINYKTAKSYKYDVDKLLEDEEYSVNAGAEVLSWFHKTYAKKEPTLWWTRFNCGTKPKVYRKTCLRYQISVERWM